MQRPFVVLTVLALVGAATPDARAQTGPDQAGLGDITLAASGEGRLKPVEVDGRGGWTVTAGQFLYADVKPDKKRSPHLRLVIQVHPGGYRGAITVPYDSSDQRAFGEPNRAGVWKPSQIQLDGQTAWVTVTLEWPDARLAGNCNGHDFRFELPAGASVVLGAGRIEALAPLPPPVQPVRLPLAVGADPRVVTSGGTLRLAGLARQEPGRPIVLNAIDAATLTLFGGNQAGTQDAPAGGAFIHFVDHAEWTFEVAAAGSYQLWQRAWFPVRGYNHDENLDGKQAVNVIDTLADTPLGQWVWVKAGRYDLPVGRHTLALAYNGGARLDRLVFQPDGLPSPTGTGPAVSPIVGTREAVVETSDAQPIEVQRWLNVGGETVTRGGGVKVELSFDNGRTWQPATFGQPLPASAGAGHNRARARLTLSAGPDGLSPLVRDLAMSYLPGANDRILLANEDVEIAFGPAGVRGLRAPRLGATMVDGAQNALFRLQVKPPGSAAPRWLSSTEAVVLGRALDDREHTLTQRFRFANGMAVVCRTRLQGADSHWELNIDNQSTLEVVSAEYPMLQNVHIGADHRDDSLMVPAVWRQLIHNPVEAQFSQGQGIRDLAMHWACLYDDQAALYLGDHNWPVNDLSIWASRHSVNSLQFGLAREFGVLPGQRRTSDNYVVAVRPGGDWHAAADIYRAWARTVLKQRPMPAWTQRMDGWFNFDSNLLPAQGFSYLAPALDRALVRGMGYYMGANRGQIDGPVEYVGMWPVYCPAWGSLQELKDMHRELRDLGGHANWYMNWQLTSPKRVIGTERIAGIIPKTWVEHATMWPDLAWLRRTSFRGYQWSPDPPAGTPQDELLQCAASPTWQAHQRDGARQWAMYGADGMYYDQISVNNPVCSLDPAYNSTGDYGAWTRASAASLADITREQAAVNPHFVTSGELANDVIGQQLTFHMTSGVYNHIELLRYCLPEQGILDGGWNGGVNDWTGGAERWRYIWMTGARFEGLSDTPYNTQLLALRRKVRALLYTAQPMDTVGLELSTAGRHLPNPPPAAGSAAMGLVANGMNASGTQQSLAPAGVEAAVVQGPQAKWFVLAEPNRGAIINVIQDKPGTGTPPPLTIAVPTARFGPVHVAWALGLDGSLTRLSGEQSAGRFTFELAAPPKATSVLLVNRLEPVVEDTDLPFAAAPGSLVGGQATVTSYDVARVTGTLTWILPPRWTASDSKYTLEPGQTKTVPVALPVPASAVKDQRYDLALTARGGDGTGTLPHWVTVGEPLWIRLLRTTDSAAMATVFNRSDQARSGDLMIAAEGGVRTGASSTPFAVGPWARTDVRLPIAGMASLRSPARLKVEARAAGRVATRRSLMLYPPIPNGGFEDDTVGDGQPDWWFTGDERDYKQFNALGRIDHTNPYKGSGCLRLEPNPEPGGKFLKASPIVRFLDQGRYRIRCAIRKTAPDDDVAVEVGSQRLSTTKAGEWDVVDKDWTYDGNLWGYGVQVVNRSRHPAWFDELSIEEVR